MNKLMKFFTGRYTALSLAVISGTIAAAGCLITLFNLGAGLYQKPLETVISSQAENMQYWYSAKIFSQMQTIADTSGNKTIEKNFDAIHTGLQGYLDTKNLEYGVIHADTLHGIDLSDKKTYIYENFQSAPPDEQSLSIWFIEKHCGDPGSIPSLIESLCTSYDFLFQDYVEDPSAKSSYTYWIVSRVKTPLDTTGSDIFVQQKNLLTSLYHYRYASVLLTLFFAIVFLSLTIFCCHQTKKISDASSPQITWKHRLPLLPYSIFSLSITSLCITVAIFLFDCLLSGSLPLGFVCMICFVPMAAAILSFVLMLVNLSTRVHAGIFWKHTLIHHLSLFIRHLHQIFTRYTSLFIRASILIIAISLCELAISGQLYNNAETLLLPFWTMIKVLEFLVLLPILLQMIRLQDGSRKLAGGNLDYKLDTAYMFPELKKHARYLNQIGDGMAAALADRLKSEHFKTELITNVSHDIKTPLTSLINYVDLLQRENITEEQRMEYLGILERQSARLKKLIEDLIEASKASTGNLIVNKEPCNIQILLTQAAGEFEEKLQANDLELLIHKPDTPVTIQADNRHLWRILDNLMNNICKYAQPETRVYIDMEEEKDTLRIIFRNTSKYALNRDGTELTERFIRGDASRHTEGNGLGLSIAQSLAESMDGTLTIHTDGDLFKVIVEFPVT
jgi:Signal transduction histidine kinase